jgi:CBS domain-containing protein
MGQHDVQQTTDEEALRAFTRHLIQDVRALEYMIAQGRFETGTRRVGAEQELFLVDDRWQPAPIVEDVLSGVEDERLVTELTRFNLEFNMAPTGFGGACLSEMEADLSDTLGYAREKVRAAGGELVLTGILPTVHLSDLGLENLTPSPRYYALNDALMNLRGGPAQFQIRGIDELFVKHDSIMLEGVNTSFQTHFQVEPDEFARFYNIAQVVAAPCLAAATNSPLLFGKRLWRETRIALFQQAVDTRSSNLYLREMSPRVHFGTGWVEDSVMEIFKEDISRFRVILTTELGEDPFEVLQQGGVPDLQALQLHNGTVYRWNRPCYGMTDGEPHLRIENRILPSGPTPADEVANAAFWFGLVSGLAERYDDVREVINFPRVKSNFVAAAREGLASQFTWLEGRKQVPAHQLILEDLLPTAENGLRSSGVDEDDIDRYLGIIEKRVETGQTGSQWQLDSLDAMEERGGGKRADRLTALVAAMAKRQQQGDPIHEWPLAKMSEGDARQRMDHTRVEHYMATDLFTVHEDEPVEFVACLMDWQRIRQVLVEDEQHRLVGLVSHRSLLRYLAERNADRDREAAPVPVREVMVEDPVSVSPDLPTVEAIALMRKHQIGALPVVREDQLVGIVTERDFVEIASQLLDDSFEGEEDVALPNAGSGSVSDGATPPPGE